MPGGWFLLRVGVLALVLCAPAALWANNANAEPIPEKTLEKESQEVNRDLFAPALDLGIWTLVIFLVLLFVLGKFAWKPMLQGLEHREQAIHSALQEAQQAREEAQRLRAQFEAQMNKANDQVREILDAARRDAERTGAEMLAQARKESQTERERLHREIDVARDQALQQIWAQTAQLATLVSAKVLRRQLNPDDHRQLVDEALAELRRPSKDGERLGLG